MCAALWAMAASAQQTPKVTLETSETLFSILVGINACGYNAELSASDPLRAQVRGEVANAVGASPEATEVQQALCSFYSDHRQSDPGRDLAQYVSLGLDLGEPPGFDPQVKEPDFPPDAAYVMGYIPLVKRFYAAAGLHAIWQKHQAQYERILEQVHDPVHRMILSTDVYLKLPISGYLGRRFVVYIEPMEAPGQVNARNYGSDYYIVAAPDRGELHLQPIRHAYLHYVLDPLAMKHGWSIRRLEPLLKTVQNAPLDDSYKRDMSLLLTESLVHAVEARTMPKASEEQKRAAAQSAAEEGFILTPYFFDALREFEKSPTGMQDAYGDLLHDIDVNHERKRALALKFRPEAPAEVVKASKARPGALLDQAEDRMSTGDIPGAQKLAQEALDKHVEDPARALFILARVATMNHDMWGAREYFERTLEVAREPRLIAWSHIYLGRIYDLQENRDAAVTHYRAALAAGDTAPETRAAAERGLQQAYQPPQRQESGVRRQESAPENQESGADGKKESGVGSQEPGTEPSNSH
jgi:tetratricopeptide (TPR) repeat protein